MGLSGAMLIDGLQYCNWSERIFREIHAGGVNAIHATICYHENFRETVANIERWNRWFEHHPDLIVPAKSAADIEAAATQRRCAIVFGAQNCSPMEADIGLVEVLHALGLRFMQLTYNNQSLLASGCYESEDTGLTRMGRQVVREMNRVGLVIDMSHSGERSTLDAISHSIRPIAITHANPSSWHAALRSKSDRVLSELGRSGGMLGLSLYPHHLKGGSACTLAEFCVMARHAAELVGVDRLGIGSDLCQDQPDSVVEWMRVGRWSKDIDYGEGSKDRPRFPPQPDWFRSNLDHRNLAEGLAAAGFSSAEVAGVMGGNWLRFFAQSFGPG